jgi:L-fucose isomerase
MYFKAGGASVEFDAAPGEMTFARLGISEDKFYMVIVKGNVLDLPEAERKEINSKTSPTWPHLHVRFPCSFEEFIDVFPCNHILAVPGDHVAELKHFCDMAGVRPVVLGAGDKGNW